MNSRQAHIISEALDYPETLTTWEYDFIDDLADKIPNYPISTKQDDILERIANKVGL